MIRKASHLDALAIAKVHVQSWYETYTGMVRQEILDQLSVQGRTALWQQVLALPQHLIWIYEDQQTILGFIDLELITAQNVAEIRAIYLLRHKQGQGIGRQLMQQAFACCTEHGITQIQLDVFDQNPSRYFYEKLGASVVAEENADDYAQGLKTLYYQWNL